MDETKQLRRRTDHPQSPCADSERTAYLEGYCAGLQWAVEQMRSTQEEASGARRGLLEKSEAKESREREVAQRRRESAQDDEAAAARVAREAEALRALASSRSATAVSRLLDSVAEMEANSHQKWSHGYWGSQVRQLSRTIRELAELGDKMADADLGDQFLAAEEWRERQERGLGDE
jgi:uncharacterized membrane protein YqiK